MFKKNKFAFSDEISEFDIVLYSWLSPLFTIPPSLIFWDHEEIKRLRTFLLDVDDTLWQLEKKEKTELQTIVIPSDLKETEEHKEQEDESTDDGMEDLSGLKELQAKKNTMFLGLAGSVLLVGVYVAFNKK